MADKREVFGLDLDNKSFIEGAKQAKDAIGSVGDPKNLEGATTGLLTMVKNLSVVAIGAWALKTAFDAVFDGEQLQKTNALFDQLAKNVGVVGVSLKEDLIKAAGGLADTADLIKAANTAMLSLGSNASKLPQIMELARTLSVKFGGDATEKFQQLSYAIASGSSRMLKANGIFIDTNKALQDFAKSMGVSVSALTEAGRQQAIMNAALEYGEKRLGNVGEQSKSLSVTWAQLKNTLKDLWEAAELAFSKIGGPLLQRTMETWQQFAVVVKDFLLSSFGDGAEKASASLQTMRNHLALLNVELMNAQKAGEGLFGWWNKLWGQGTQKNIDDIKSKIASTTAEINKMETQISTEKEKELKKQTAEVQKANKEQLVDHHKAAEERIKLEHEVLQMQIKNNEEAIKLTSKSEEYVKLSNQRKELLERQNVLAKKKIEEDFETGKINSKKQKDKMLEQLEVAHNLKLKQLNKQEKKEYDQVLQNKLDEANNVADGIAAGFEAGSARAEAALRNFGATGTMVFNTISNRSAEAFTEMGKAAIDHSKSASQIMRGFFLNALADMAESQGKLFLAAGLFGNPGELAAGVELLALSGALRAMAGQGGGGVGGVSGGGAGGSSGGGAYAGSGAVNQNQPQESEQKSVTVQVMGDWLNTDQTKRLLMQYVRDATDATDFKYVQIGQT